MQKSVDAALERAPRWCSLGLPLLGVLAAASRVRGLVPGTSVAGESADWIRSIGRLVAPIGLEGAPLLIALKLLGVAAAALSVVAFGWLAHAVFRDRVVALASAAVFAVLPVAWWWSTEIVPDPLLVSGLVCLSGVTARVLERNPKSRWSRLMTLGVGLAVVVILSLWFDSRLRATSGVTFSATMRPLLDGASYSFSPAGVAIAAVGLLLGVLLVPRAGWLAILWVAPFAVALWRTDAASVELRTLLAVTPAVALAVGGLFASVRRFVIAPVAVLVMTAVLVGAMVAHAAPDLGVLWSRRLPSDAVAQYIAEYVPDGAVVLAGPEAGVIPIFAENREVLRFSMTAYEVADPRVPTGAAPFVLGRVAAAFEEGRPVFASSLLGPDERSILRGYCAFEPVMRIDRKALRGQWDPRLAVLGERMRRATDVTIWRLTPSPRPMMRVLAAPTVTATDAEHVEVVVDEPLAANARVAIFVAQHPASLDWARDTFGRDNLLQRTLVTGVRRGLVLDAEGRGTQRVRLPNDTPARCYMAYAIQGADGRMAAVSLPAPHTRR